MEYTNFPQPPQPSNPNPTPVDPCYSSHYTYYPYHLHPQTLNPNPEPNPKTHEFYTTVAPESAIRPPGVESYASLGSYPDGHGGYEAQAGAQYDLHQTVDTTGYYPDPNAHNWALKEAVQQYGFDPAGYTGAGFMIPPNGIEQLAIANPSSTLWANQVAQPHGNGTWKKRPKKTKIIQSAFCEVCKIDCNSKDVLDQHKLGKKHKKNLEKLQEATASTTNASAGSSVPVIGPEENPNKSETVNSQKSRKKAAEPAENLETKRRKIVDGGAAVEAVRTCALCNVVCNSETVFNYHLAGQKHAAMARKHAAAAT